MGLLKSIREEAEEGQHMSVLPEQPKIKKKKSLFKSLGSKLGSKLTGKKASHQLPATTGSLLPGNGDLE